MKRRSVWEGGEAFVQPEESLVARVGSIICGDGASDSRDSTVTQDNRDARPPQAARQQ
jgi:hypothetical protein